MPEDDLYRDHVLDHYEQPYHRGCCPGATHAHQDTNPLCGDTIRIELKVGPEDCIQCAYFRGDGCCISQAAASMLVEHLEGKSISEVRSFGSRQMLDLFGPRLTPTRRRCCLLAWRVLQSACASGPFGSAKQSTQPTAGRCPRGRIDR